MSVSNRTKAVLAALGGLAVLTLLYSILVLQNLFALVSVWTSIVVTVALMYLGWRFVRAVERIAAALESMDGTDAEGYVTDE